MNAELRAQLDTVVQQLLAEEPAALVVLLFGSFARGTAGPFSDVDVRVFTVTPPRQRDRVRLTRVAGRLVHWSIGARTLDEKLRELAEPNTWRWAAAHYRDMQPLHDPHNVLGLLRAAVERAKPEPLAYATDMGFWLESLLEYVAKLENAASGGACVEPFVAAAKAAHYCELLLRPLNPVATFADEAEERAYFASLPIVPPHWAQDLAVCSGTMDATRTRGDLVAAARRMALGTAALLRERVDALPFPADVAGLLRDGSIEAYLACGLSTAKAANGSDR